MRRVRITHVQKRLGLIDRVCVIVDTVDVSFSLMFDDPFVGVIKILRIEVGPCQAFSGNTWNIRNKAKEAYILHCHRLDAVLGHFHRLLQTCLSWTLELVEKSCRM